MLLWMMEIMCGLVGCIASARYADIVFSEERGVCGTALTRLLLAVMRVLTKEATTASTPCSSRTIISTFVVQRMLHRPRFSVPSREPRNTEYPRMSQLRQDGVNLVIGSGPASYLVLL